METTTNRRKPSIIHDGFAYSVYRRNKEGQTMRCTKRGCNAKIIKETLIESDVHDHEETGERNCERKALRNACKRKGEDLMSDVQDNAAAASFADYALTTYIDGSSPFPPELWAQKEASSLQTNNGAESFHGHSKKNFYTAHPTI